MPLPNVNERFLDLDNFKLLKDAHGQGVGDVLLRSTEKLCPREMDSVARIGGDEFGVLIN